MRACSAVTGARGGAALRRAAPGCRLAVVRAARPGRCFAPLHAPRPARLALPRALPASDGATASPPPPAAEAAPPALLAAPAPPSPPAAPRAPPPARQSAETALLLLSLCYLHASACGYALPALLPDVANDLALSDPQAASLTFAFTLTYSLLLIPAGHLADIVDRPKLLAAGERKQGLTTISHARSPKGLGSITRSDPRLL